MKRLLIGTVLMLTGIGSAFSLPKVTTIMKKLDVMMELNSDITVQTEMVQQIKGQGTKQTSMIFYRRDVDDSFLVVITGPDSDKGNGYLKVGDNMWMYRQNTRTFQHINRDESISGSDMKAGDMERKKTSELYKPVLDKDGKEIISETMLGKIPVYKVEIIAKVKDVTYAKKIYWVRKDNYLPLKEQSFSLSDTLMQTAYYLKYTIVGGKYIPTHQIFIDEFDKGNKTIMKFKGIALKKISRSVFTKAYLENLSK